MAIDKMALPMSDNLSGMCIKADGSRVIAINSKMSLGRQRFSLAHELYHLYYDENMTAICSATMNTGSETERSADMFAAFFLMPPSSLKSKVASMRKDEDPHINLEDVIQLEQYYGVSHQAMLNQLIDIGVITKIQAAAMKTGVTRAAAAHGFSTDLYRELPADKQYQTNGYLIEQASIALAQDLISEGKYEEILLQAFRPDLVFGDEDEGGEAID